MLELDNTIGDLHSIIVDNEDAIRRELETYILSTEDAIVKLTDDAAELDW